MPHIVGDRFLALGHQWIDLATAAPVHLRILTAGPRMQQAIWTENCDALGRLRHPLLNPLIDYGALDAVRLFEAYAVQPRVHATGATAGRLLLHATRFLEIHGVQLTRPVAEFAIRPVADAEPHGPRGARALAGRPAGIVLQPRRVLDDLAEMLDGHAGGPIGIDVCGGTGSGLRTLQLLAARLARLHGYVPVCGQTLMSWPWIADALLDRHVCMLSRDGATAAECAAVARLLARLGAASARGHAAVRFRRGEASGSRALRADPLGVTAMTTMVYFDDHCDPGSLFRAAREAEGRPGVFLTHLNAARFDAPTGGSALVHETAARYDARPRTTLVVPAAPARSRTARAAVDACAHAAGLAARGRHAAAHRVLSRAFRVRHGRGDLAGAADAALHSGWLLRERGDIEAALRHFDRARTVHTHERTSVAAAIATAVCWTDEARLREAEAAARGALAAADVVGDLDLAHRAAIVLARLLLWLGRVDEARALVQPILARTSANLGTDARALDARLRLATGDLPGALSAARDALRVGGTTGRPRPMAVAYRAAAAASAAVGDLAAVEAYAVKGLAAARAARAPLASLRLRAELAAALNACEPDGERTARVNASLRRVAARRLPRLLRWQLLAAAAEAPAGDLAKFVDDTGARALVRPPGVTVDQKFSRLRRFIELCHSAPDDRAALERVCADLLDELHATTVMVVGKEAERRRLAIAGRAWAGEPRTAFNAADGGISIPPSATESPAQAAEPVTYGGEVIAALCCRWTAGSLVHAEHASTLLRLAALASGPSARSMLDRAPATPGGQVCPELIGASAAADALRLAIARAARAPFPVLIEGESGTGKELVARAIHRLGPRRDRRFCAINCAAISDDLLEAELFGHARGAFTGAVTERAGVFEEADGGTLFLDEVGELSGRAQAKLLRVLQEGEVRRIGENFPRRVDAHVIAATNRRIADEVDAGRFRADLRYRLDVVRIEVPPLRDRAADISLLASRFWSDATARVGSSASLAPEAVSALARYDWPGNVRELQNVIASMSLYAPRRGRVTASLVPPHVARAFAPSATSFEIAREDFERRFLRAALARAAGHPGRTARALGISRQGLAKMLKRLRIDGRPL